MSWPQTILCGFFWGVRFRFRSENTKILDDSLLNTTKLESGLWEGTFLREWILPRLPCLWFFFRFSMSNSPWLDCLGFEPRILVLAEREPTIPTSPPKHRFGERRDSAGSRRAGAVPKVPARGPWARDRERYGHGSKSRTPSFHIPIPTKID